MFATQNINYLYNSQGEWVAFRKGKNVFTCNSEWIGWLPWGDGEVVSIDGDYIGTIINSNRFYFLTNRIDRGSPGTCGIPYFPGVFPPPNMLGRDVLRAYMCDVNLSGLGIILY